MVPESAIPGRILSEMLDIARTATPGAIVEVGVWRGGSAFHLAEIARSWQKPLFLYDTFTGIPLRGPHDSHDVGDFGDTSVDEVRAAIPDCTVIPGVFPYSIVAMPPLGFVHVDCDQYQSVKSCCERLTPLLLEGGIMYFDDYGCLEGATRAVDECFTSVHRTLSGRAYVRKHGVAPRRSAG